MLLFTDLHAGNVLSGERRPWLLIDPKPYRRGPALRRPAAPAELQPSLQADPINLLTEVADLAGLDAGRVRQWLFAGASRRAWARVARGRGSTSCWPGWVVRRPTTGEPMVWPGSRRVVPSASALDRHLSHVRCLIALAAINNRPRGSAHMSFPTSRESSETKRPHNPAR